MMTNPIVFTTRTNSGSILSVVIPLCLLIHPAIALDRIVELTNGAAMPLQQTVIEVRVSEIDSFAGGDFRFDYDPTVLSIDDVQPAASTGSFLIAYDFPDAGMLAASLASVDGLTTYGETAILRIVLSPLSSATVGTVTPIVFHLARWYDENSVRYRLLADNALFTVGDSVPGDEVLNLAVGSKSSFPRGSVEIPLNVSMGAGIGEVSGEIHFDPLALGPSQFTPAPELTGWSRSIVARDDSITFSLVGNQELQGIEPVVLGWFQFEVFPSSVIGAAVTMELQDAEARSLQECPFLANLENGHVFIGNPPSSVDNWFLLDP